MTNSIFRPAAVLLSLFTLLTGVVYPLAVTGLAQLAFQEQANGSLLRRDGQIIGSRLIGQPFDDMRYFWARPSATNPSAYNASASTGSNLGPTNPVLITAVRQRIAAARSAHPDQASTTIPVDLVTTSGSGLDPHISPAAALYQVGRVAAARRLKADSVKSLVLAHIEGRSLGLLGEPRVNVLSLNIALDELAKGGA